VRSGTDGPGAAAAAAIGTMCRPSVGGHKVGRMHGISGQQFAIDCFVFALAVFVGFELITKVPAILHTPLMSATNAIHGIVLVGAITVAAVGHDAISNTIAVLAVFLGTLNVVGGFVVTDRMLEMFRAKPQPPKAKEPEKAA
jgi:H+-translocating NAD(P) transhydrogenase subunit alpha